MYYSCTGVYNPSLSLRTDLPLKKFKKNRVLSTYLLTTTKYKIKGNNILKVSNVFIFNTRYTGNKLWGTLFPILSSKSLPVTTTFSDDEHWSSLLAPHPFKWSRDITNLNLRRNILCLYRIYSPYFYTFIYTENVFSLSLNVRYRPYQGGTPKVYESKEDQVIRQ